MKHIPKGMACASCAYKDRDCSSLEFETMPVLQEITLDGKPARVVRCKERVPMARKRELAGSIT